MAEGQPGADAIRDAGWIDVQQADAIQAEGYALVVDGGEAEAIALARHNFDSLLLIDDDRGRRLAMKLGLRIKGTLGILIAAKRAGLLPAVKPELMVLRERGVFVTEALIVATLAVAGEE